MIKNILISAIVLTLLGCDATSNLSKNDLTVLELQAQKGNSEALNRLGEHYHFNAQPDYKKAYNYYLKAAEIGNGEAANHLGRMYLNGEGVPQSEGTALSWYKKSAALGNKDGAQNANHLQGSL